MTAGLGFAGVLTGLVSAVALALRGFGSLREPRGARRRALRGPVVGLVGGAVAAMASLEVALLANDFSLRYVAENSARDTPLVFKVATAWAALEGSIVLWGLVLAAYALAVFLSFQDGDRLGAGALAVVGVVAIFFFGMMATFANPFRVLATVPADGPGPNPLLQNHILMAVHPPLLYVGFVGFTVPFAYAMSALLLGEGAGGAEWLRRTRSAGLVAWVFLTSGIVMGGWWSYEVLGWGGYWAWDPVENASFIPWLVATAFVHSAVAQARRGMLRTWNFGLVISTFALTILGTFLTRSGVIASVHSFTESPVGPAFLGFFLFVLAGGFGLFAARAHLLAVPRRLESLFSREGAFLVNNLLLSLFAFAVLTGTLYPMFVEAFTGAQVSVGRPFFDRMAIPLSLALIAAMAIGPAIPYRAPRPAVVWARVRQPVLAALATGALLVVLGVQAPYVVVVAMLAVLVAAAAVRQLVVTWRAGDRRGGLIGIVRGDAGYWGGQLSHIGAGMVALAIAASGSLGAKSPLVLPRGEPVAFGSYLLVYDGSRTWVEPGREVAAARIVVRRGDDTVRVLEPRLNQFRNTAQAIGTPAVWSRIGEDLYLSLTRLDGDAAAVVASRHPLMWLLWTGGITTAVGGLVAMAGRRRRLPARTPPPVVARPDLVPEREVVHA